METKTFLIDTRVAAKLAERSAEEAWPVHLRIGRPFATANGNRMVQAWVEHKAWFRFEEKLGEVVNDSFGLPPLPEGGRP